MKLLRVASVPYLNGRPLVDGLQDAPGVLYSEDVPARLARRLAAGEVDVALVSSIEAARCPERILADLCIASRGPVWSVQLCGARDPRAATSVALDGASLTAAALTRIYYAHILGRSDVAFRAAPPAPDPAMSGADATLVIGDAGLRLKESAFCRVDLGEAWTAATSLPFVWAVWLLAEGADAAAAQERLTEARERGLARLDEHARAAALTSGVPEEVAREYLARIVYFRLGAEEQAGLEQFWRMSRDVL
ncbi:MAG: menaquinone biosynthesis protein [Planctomycetes bacterium]|nr:menaquinone biosynthesis protein [Planctomycetota bacterium]